MFYLNETISAVPGIFINEVRTIEKGKKKENPLWQAYSSKVSNEQKVNLIKELFGFKSEEEFSK